MSEYVRRICLKCGNEFSTKYKGKDLCPRCNPFNMSFANQNIIVIDENRSKEEEEEENTEE